MATYLQIERGAEFAVVRFCREPVNTMNLAFWQQLLQTLEELEADPEMRGVIFMSGVQVRVGGEFWLTSNRFLQRLYVSPLVTVAAIRGACPAGGCCLSLCCDYRLQTSEGGSMGLNEVALGISVPKYWGRLMARVIGQGPTEKLLQAGLIAWITRALSVATEFAVMLTPEEAQEVGLVDELVPKYKLQAAAEAAMRQMLRSPDHSRAATKRLLRSDFAAAWAAYADGEATTGWQQLSSPQVVEQLGAVLARLSAKKQRQSKL
eukprot:scaffold12.g7966.t1